MLLNTPKLMNYLPNPRSLIWRLGRRMYLWARQDVVGGPEMNGEYWILDKVIGEFCCDDQKSIFFDIGANLGNWTECASELLKSKNCAGTVYAFEPTHDSYAYLSSRFSQTTHVKVKNFAVSDTETEKEFFVVGKLAGTNSLTPLRGAKVEKVMTLKLDDFLRRENIDKVRFVKSDTEGHDFSVLQGAIETLRAGRIDVWQFEYNHLWITQKAFLKDVFDMIADMPYYIGKLQADGVELYDQWHPELEKFFDSNYVLIKKDFPLNKYCSNVRFNVRNTSELRGRNDKSSLH